jgi:hypothetical protein
MSARIVLHGKEADWVWAELTESIRQQVIEAAEVVVETGTDRLLYELRKHVTLRSGAPAPEGQPPARQTGALADAFKSTGVQVNRKRSRVYGQVTTKDRVRHDGTDWWEVIGALEYGSSTRGGGGKRTSAKRNQRMAAKFDGVFHTPPHPFIRPSEYITTRVMDAQMNKEFGR